METAFVIVAVILASEIIEKFYSDVPGIYIQVENL